MTKPLERLLGLLDERVFKPTRAATAASYPTAEEAALLRRVQKRVHETRVRYFGDYSTAAQVKANFVQDLHSKPGQELANDMYLLGLTRFEDLRDEFLALCKQLGGAARKVDQYAAREVIQSEGGSFYVLSSSPSP